MIYSYGGRVDNDSNAITIIDEENVTAETKGYVNGEYVEFGDGGSGGAEPLIITRTESELGVTFEEIDSAVNEHRNIFIDNHLVAGTNKIVPLSGSSYYELAMIATEPGSTTIFVEVVRVNADGTFSSRVISITGTLAD